MVTIKANYLRDLRSKAIGLLGKEIARPVYFQTRWGIHTFGLKFPIDVLILDQQNIVKILKKELNRNRFFFWNPKYNGILELPIGTIQRLKICQGTKINLMELGSSRSC